MLAVGTGYLFDLQDLSLEDDLIFLFGRPNSQVYTSFRRVSHIGEGQAFFKFILLNLDSVLIVTLNLKDFINSF